MGFDELEMHKSDENDEDNEFDDTTESIEETINEEDNDEFNEDDGADENKDSEDNKDSNDNEDEKIEDIFKGKKYGLIFSFNKITYIDGIKATKYNNPNYVKSMSGNILFFVDTARINIGKITWDQKRTKDMDPPKPIRKQIKERWNNPGQTGMIGFAAAKLVGGVIGGAGKLMGLSFGEVTQEEDLRIEIKDQFLFSSNKSKIGEGAENEEGEPTDYTSFRIKKIRNALNKFIGENNDNLLFELNMGDEDDVSVGLEINFKSDDGDDHSFVNIKFGVK